MESLRQLVCALRFVATDATGFSLLRFATSKGRLVPRHGPAAWLLGCMGDPRLHRIPVTSWFTNILSQSKIEQASTKVMLHKCVKEAWTSHSLQGKAAISLID